MSTALEKMKIVFATGSVKLVGENPWRINLGNRQEEPQLEEELGISLVKLGSGMNQGKEYKNDRDPNSLTASFLHRRTQAIG